MIKANLVAAFVAMAFFSLGQKWEYKKVVIGAKPHSYPNLEMTKMEPNEFDIDESWLGIYGSEGWELVSAVATQETIHPNFGNDKYVSGLQPNVRTKEIILFFKRQSKPVPTKK